MFIKSTKCQKNTLTFCYNKLLGHYFTLTKSVCKGRVTPTLYTDPNHFLQITVNVRHSTLLNVFDPFPRFNFFNFVYISIELILLEILIAIINFDIFE